MGKLSKEGKLYLKDYLILNRARDEANKFLDAIVEEVDKRLQAEDLAADDFKIEVWQSQSVKGQLQLQFRSEKDSDLLRKDKVDLYLVYRDVRNTKNLPSTKAAKIFVYIPDEAAKLKEELADDVYKSKVVEFDLSSSDHTAEEVTAAIIDKFNQIKKLLSQLPKNNS